MLIKPDCIPCILKMTISSLRKLPLDESSVKALYADILQIPALRGLVWDITSPEIIEDVWKKIVAKVNSRDPFYEAKLRQNERITTLYPFLEKMVNEATDPLKLAVKLSILGNSMDFMVADSSLAIEESIEAKAKLPLSDKNYSMFRQQLQVTRRLLIFGDNAGEIVFDRLLIEELLKADVELTYCVKSRPIINDATMEDARAAGIDALVPVIETGSGDIGINFDNVSEEFLAAFRSADLILTKGHGNFETCHDLAENIYFLLKVKCDVVARELGVEKEAIVFKSNRYPVPDV